jgi:hypothetical protein
MECRRVSVVSTTISTSSSAAASAEIQDGGHLQLSQIHPSLLHSRPQANLNKAVDDAESLDELPTTAAVVGDTTGTQKAKRKRRRVRKRKNAHKTTENQQKQVTTGEKAAASSSEDDSNSSDDDDEVEQIAKHQSPTPNAKNNPPPPSGTTTSIHQEASTTTPRATLKKTILESSNKTTDDGPTVAPGMDVKALWTYMQQSKSQLPSSAKRPSGPVEDSLPASKRKKTDHAAASTSTSRKSSKNSSSSKNSTSKTSPDGSYIPVVSPAFLQVDQTLVYRVMTLDFEKKCPVTSEELQVRGDSKAFVMQNNLFLSFSNLCGCRQRFTRLKLKMGSNMTLLCTCKQKKESQSYIGAIWWKCEC